MAHEIIEGVYVGPISMIFNKEFIKDIDIIVNCTKEEYPLESGKKYYRIPVDDTERQVNIDDFVYYGNLILPDVIEDYKNGSKILIHCSQGVQRSAAFMAIFLIRHKNYLLNEAIDFIVSKKNNCFSHGRNVNFLEALKKMI